MKHRSHLYLSALIALAIPCAAQIIETNEAHLLEVLSSPDRSMAEKARACQDLSVVGTEAAIAPLAALLGEEVLGEYARQSLEIMPLEAVNGVLRNALGRSSGLQRAALIASLGTRRDEKAVPLVAALLEDHPEAALHALARIKTPESISYLVKQLPATDPARRTTAASATLLAAQLLAESDDTVQALALLERIEGLDLPAVLILSARTEHLLLSSRLPGAPGAAVRLMEMLQSGDEAVVRAALHVVRETTGRDMLTSLAPHLPAVSEAVALRLVRTLADRGADSGPLLRVFLETGSATVRMEAARAFSYLETPGFTPLLMKLAQGDGPLAAAALQSLRSSPAPDINATLMAAVTLPNGPHRATWIGVLADREYIPAVKIALEMLALEDETLAKSASSALGKIAGIDDLPALIAIMNTRPEFAVTAGVDIAFARSLRRMDNPTEAAGAVLDGLKVASPESRLLLLRLLARTGGDQAFTALVAAIKDPSDEVRNAAVRALSVWPDAVAAPELFRLASDPSNPTLQGLAIEGYLRLLHASGDADPVALAGDMRTLYSSPGMTSPHCCILAAMMVSKPG